MAGTRKTIIDKVEYNFNNGSGTVVAVKAMDVVNWREGALLVRVHSTDVASSSTLDVIARIIAPTEEEPSVDYIYTTTDIAKVTLNSSTTAPSLERAAMADDFGAYLQITVVGTKSGGNCAATISAELVLKT